MPTGKCVNDLKHARIEPIYQRRERPRRQAEMEPAKPKEQGRKSKRGP
jgi:hypothetical protein